jgi:hypothetical protein
MYGESNLEAQLREKPKKPPKKSQAQLFYLPKGSKGGAIKKSK